MQHYVYFFVPGNLEKSNGMYQFSNQADSTDVLGGNSYMFLLFPHAFPHALPSVSPVSSDISHVYSSVSPLLIVGDNDINQILFNVKK